MMVPLMCCFRLVFWGMFDGCTAYCRSVLPLPTVRNDLPDKFVPALQAPCLSLALTAFLVIRCPFQCISCIIVAKEFVQRPKAGVTAELLRADIEKATHAKGSSQGGAYKLM